MVVRFLFLTLFCAVFFPIAPPAYAQSGSCTDSKVAVSVKTATGRTSYSRDKSSAELTEMHGGGGAVGGLGGGEVGFKAEAQYRATRVSGSSSICVKLRSLEIVFFAKPKIHIASNFRRGTCEYGAVMAHEKKHVRELLKFVREYRPKVKSYMEKAVVKARTSYPARPSKVNDAQEQIQEDILKEIETLQGKIMPILNERQQAIDSEEEYARVTAKCGDWNERLSQTPNNR